MNRLAILGASGHGKVVADTALVCGWRQIDFFDDAWPARLENGHWNVVGNSAELLLRLDAYDGVFIAIGNNMIRLGAAQLAETEKTPATDNRLRAFDQTAEPERQPSR